MAKRIQYTDYYDRPTEIVLFRGYKVQPPDYEFCAGDVPLRYTWHGEQYDTIRGSEITFSVLIKDGNDRNELDDILRLGGYYVNVVKDGRIVWFGKLFPQYFIEPYRQYPYVIDMNASDQLGQLKQYQSLMIDFPEPDTRVSLIELVNKLLTDPSFKPALLGGYQTAPDRLRVSSRIYTTTEWQLFEEVYIDPLCFMEIDADQYISKHDMLTAILEPLFLKLFQWNGYWYILSLDGQYDNGWLTYREYILDPSGYTAVGQITAELEIVDLYEVQTEVYPDNRQVYNNAIMEYLPSWQNVTIAQNFEKNTNILPVYANRSGRFYHGQDGIYLEFNEPANNLRHWTTFGYLYTEQVSDNAGVVQLETNPYTYYNNRKEKIFNITSDGYNGFKIELESWFDVPGAGDDENLVLIELEINFTYKGTIYYLWDNYQQFYGWSTDFRICEVPIGTTTIEAPVPGSVTADDSASMKISILRPKFDYSGSTMWYTYLTDFTVALVYNDWDAINYAIETAIVVSEAGTVNKDFTYMWGLYSNTLPNYHEAHLSAPYDSSGEPIPKFSKSGSALVSRRLIDWQYQNFQTDNSYYTPKLTASYRAKDITPLNLIWDYERRAYQFMSGVYEDKICVWTNKYIQAKWVDDVPPVLCDFSEQSFNEDFCTEII